MKGLKNTLTNLGISISKTLFSPILFGKKYRNQANATYFSVGVCLRCLLHHILSLIAYTFRENRDFVSITSVQFMMSSNIIRLFVHNQYHHCANLSEDTELVKYLSDIFC